MANGTYDTVHRAAEITFRIGGHTNTYISYIILMDTYDLILGMSQIDEYYVSIRGGKRTLTFDYSTCKAACLDRGLLSTIYIDKRAKLYVKERPLDPSNSDICLVSTIAFAKLAKRRDYKTYVLQPKDFVAEDNEHLQSFVITSKDFDKFIITLAKTNPLTKLPKEYYNLVDVFRHKDDFKLLPRRKVDYTINLKPSEEPPFKRGYAINAESLATIKKYINKNLATGVIKPLYSSYVSPVLLVRKLGGGLRVCVDYRALNAITIKDRYPIPLIRETLDRLYKVKFFTKLDIVAAFNNLRIRKGDEHLIAFITRYRLY